MFKPTKVIDKRTPSRTKMNEETNQNIQVFVRCRPLNSNEKKGSIDVIPEKRSIRTIQHNKSYSFDNVFDDKAKQIDVYRSVVEPLVEQVIEGYNCTVFAYGQTGTGKTYTMVGNRSDSTISWEDDPLSGIIPRAIDQLIDELQNQNTEYTIRVSFLELYNEDAYDLLSALSDTSKLRIYNDSERKGSVIISGLVEMIVQTKAEIFEILEKGSLKRQTAPTLMNACSSRSHSIFSITVHIKETTFDGEEVVKMGKLNLVDLAGSENIGRSGAVEERFREASNINKSLLTLGRVITSLVEKSSHIPYRDSKLTRLLQDSLGGKTKTSIIATISPCVDDIEDTVSTLDYAQRAKKITNKPEVNLKMSKKTLLHEYLNEIDRLRRDLEATRDKKGIFVDAKNYAHMEATIKSQEQDLELKEAQIESMKQELDKYSILLTETNEDLSNKRQELNETKEKLEELSNYLIETKEILEKTQNEVEDCKVVIDVHKKNEKKLLKKAQTVLTVADKCVDDNQKLFSKLDLLTFLQNFNVNSLQKFKENSIEEMANINKFNSLIKSEISHKRQVIEDCIKENQEKIKNKNSELETNINKIKQNIENFSSVLIESLKKNDDCDEKSDIDIYSWINIFKNVFSNELNQFSNTLKENAEEQNAILDQLSQESVKNYSILEESIMSQSSKINDCTKNLTFLVQSCDDFSKQIYDHKTEKLGELNQEILKTKETLNKVNISQKLEKMETELEKLKELEKTLSQSLIGIKAEYEENVVQFSDVSLKSFQNRVHSMLEHESEIRNEISFKFKELICSINKYEKENLKYLSELDTQNNLNCESTIQKYDQIKKIHQRLESFLNQFKSKNDAQINEWISKIDEKINLIIQTIDKATIEQTNQIESDHLIANEISKLIDETLNEILENYKKMESECKAFCGSQNYQLDEFSKKITLFETDYKKYQPSGCTPKRQEFSYPKTFTPTSAHEKIISSYRQHHHQNDNCNGDFENVRLSFNENGIDICDENIENQIENPSNVANATFDIKKIDSSATTTETSNRTFLCKKRFLKEKN